jgi:putative methyltransferase (TIGR04325 family)
VYDSLEEGQAVAGRYMKLSHECDDNAKLHLSLSKVARPSDYPVLFHLEKLLPRIGSVFDLGGNVGNLFYCYAKYLDLPPGLRWTVYDLPGILEIGRRLAHERQEYALTFTASFQEANGADVLLASGSSHYFVPSLPDLLRPLMKKPKYVILNRTPLLGDHGPVVTVQDAGTFLVACTLYREQDIIAGFESLNYEKIDSWRVPELSIRIPFYPECTIHEYSGFLFRLERAAT